MKYSLLLEALSEIPLAGNRWTLYSTAMNKIFLYMDWIARGESNPNAKKFLLNNSPLVWVDHTKRYPDEQEILIG